MSFTPAAPLSLIYTQNQTSTVVQQTVLFAVPNNPSSVTNIQILNLPAWLTASNVFYNTFNNEIEFNLKIKNVYANNMSAGDYSTAIQVKYIATINGSTSTFSSFLYQINFTLISNILLTVSPTVLAYSHVFGESNPQNQALNIESSSNWTISADESWVDLPLFSGVGSSQISIGVNPTSLAIGQWYALITIQDAQSTKTVSVTLSITEESTEIDYLFVLPQGLNFVSELGVENTTTKSINIESSGNWSATTTESWLQLSTSSGSEGITPIDVSVDSDALTDLTTPYLAQIVITQQNLQKTVFVELYLVEFLTQGIESEGLYFSDDRNKLEVTNLFPNMFLYLEGTISNGVQTLSYKFNAPYQNGLAKVLFGLETNVMLKSVIPTNNFSTRIKNNISPVLINFTALNKHLTYGTNTFLSNWQNVRFLTGKTPIVTDKLCYVPDTIHVTKDAILSLSCLSTTELTEITITGDATATYNTVIADNLLVYNAIIDLSVLNLSIGANITITFGVITVNVVIKDTGLETTLLAFENEWREYEFFEFTGALSINDKATHTTTEIQEEAAEHTKTVSIISGKDYSVSTGLIYSQEEIDWLARLLKSKRVFIYQNNEPIEVVLGTKTLNTYQTRKAYNSYNVKFSKAIVE